MGKKSKKLNKVQDNELPTNNVEQLEPDEMNVNSETNFQTDSVKKSKKKNRKRNSNGTIIEDMSVQIKSDEINESNILENPTTKKIKRKKNKKHTKLSEEGQNDTDSNILKEDQLEVSKKKKKKSKLLDEGKPIIETCVEAEDHKPQKDPKGKKNKKNTLNEPNLVKQEAPKQHNDTNQQQKKVKNKAKTGAPVLNDEESQVTEEDIDRFIDELDEEDNKQYEDWVKLINARLSKKQRTE